MGEPLTYDLAETQQVLGLGRTKTMELIATGEIPSLKVGRRRLVPRQACVDFIQRKLAEVQEPAAS